MKKFIYYAAAIGLCTAACLPAGCFTQTSEKSLYELTITYNDQTATVEGTCAFTFYNDTENELSDLKFNLYGNAYREGALYTPVATSNYTKAYYNGTSYGAMEVSSVENCAGWTIAGDDKNILCVNLLQSVYPAQTVTVTIAYTLQLAKVNHRTGVTQNTVNLGNCYPVLCAYDNSEGFIECVYEQQGDPFLSECADYIVYADIPAEYTAATSGEVKNQSEVDGHRKYTFTQQNARDFALVLSTHFSVLTATENGTTINYYYYNDNSPQTNLAVVQQSFAYYAKTFGDYPYSTLAVVQTGFCYAGMEYPALCMISDTLDSDTAVYTIAHEVAHQWWYATVGSDQLLNAWQDEGLAEYSALLFFENNPAYSYTRTGLINTATKAYRSYFSVYNQLFGKADTSMNRALSSYAGDYEYVNIAYNKGMLLFEYLRQSIGDTKFLQGLKRYYAANTFRIATPDDLFSCYTQEGDDLQGFFDSFLNGKIII